MIPKYSPRALFGAAFLFRKFNEIDIYIEDTSNRAMFDTIIRKIVSDKYKFTRLHQLGGKKAVLDRCAIDQKEDKNRKKIYIVDGDLDLLTGEKNNSLKFLYSLKVYCIENILLCKNALIAVAHQDACDLSTADIESKLDIETTYQSVIKLILPLFVNYAIVHSENTGHETISYSVYKLSVNDKGIDLDKAKVRKRILSFKKDLISELGRSKFYSLRKKIIGNIEKYSLKQHNLICAKTIILRIIFEKFKKEFNTRCTYEQFKNRLASELDHINDPGLSKALID